MNENWTLPSGRKKTVRGKKMLLHGPAALSNAELLAILIGSGNTEETAVELMRKVLDDCHNRLSELENIRWTIFAVIKELVRQRPWAFWQPLVGGAEEEEPSERKKITSSQRCVCLFYPLMCATCRWKNAGWCCWIRLPKVIDTVKISREDGLHAGRCVVFCVRHSWNGPLPWFFVTTILREIFVRVRMTTAWLCAAGSCTYHEHPSCFRPCGGFGRRLLQLWRWRAPLVSFVGRRWKNGDFS